MFVPESFSSAMHMSGSDTDPAELARRKSLFVKYPGFKVWYRHEGSGI